MSSLHLYPGVRAVTGLLRSVVGVASAAWALFWGVSFVATREPVAFLACLVCVVTAWWLLEDGT